MEDPGDNIYDAFSHVLQNKLANGKPFAKAKSPPAHKKSQAVNGLLETEKNNDTMLLEFEETNSTIYKYLNILWSDDDKELPPRKNGFHNNNIKPPPPNPKRVKFSKESNGIYDTGATSGVGALEDANYFISTGKKSNIFFVITNSDTMSATERMKLAH